MPNQQMIRYRAPPLPLTRALAPAAVSGLAKTVARAVMRKVWNSTPSAESLAAKAGRAVRNYQSERNPPAVAVSSSRGEISVPVAIGTRVTARKARIQSGPRSTIVTHRELLQGSVAGSTTFTTQYTFPLNPGMASSFPWLSTQAQQFEMYRFRKLCFEWVPIAPTSTQGDIAFIPDYDASNAPPTTEVQAYDHVNSVIDAVWRPFSISLDPVALHGLGPRRFVRASAVPGDIKTFDCGNLYVCTNNETGTSAVGKVFVSYEVELFTPQNGPLTGTVATTTSVFNLITSNQVVLTATNTVVAFNGQLANALNIVNSSGTFTPPSGFYRIHACVGFDDTTSELLYTSFVFQKNGANVTAGIIGASKVSSDGGTEIGQLHAYAYLPCNGTDAITLVANLTGAAGTLSLLANFCMIEFSLV